MADERFIVDIILNARDNTARAMASAIGNAKALQAIEKDMKRDAEGVGRAHEAMAQRINTSRAELTRKSQELHDTLKREGQLTNDNIKSWAALETETKKYTRTLADANASEAQIAAAHVRARESQDRMAESLAKSRFELEKNGESWKELSKVEQLARVSAERNHAMRIANLAAEAERVQQVTQEYVAGAKEQAKSDNERAESRKKTLQIIDEAEKDSAKRRSAQREAELQEVLELERRRKEAVDNEAAAERELAELRQTLGEKEHQRREQEWAEEQERLRARDQAERDRAQAELERAQAEREIAEIRQQLGEKEHQLREQQWTEDQENLRQREQGERELAELRQQLGEREHQERVRLWEEEQAQEEARRESARRRADEGHELVRQGIQDELEERDLLARREKRADDERKARFAEAQQLIRQGLSEEQAEQEMLLRVEKRRRDEQEGNLRTARDYIATVRKIADLERERERLKGIGDTEGVARVDLDAGQVRAQAQELAVGLRAILDHIEANVDLDGTEAQAHALALRTELHAILGHEYKINVDLDARRFRRELQEVNRDLNDSSSTLGTWRGVMKKFGDEFNNSSGKIASFDNFLRGLMSLGIALFFEPLILLAGAAGGALLALASSAATAGLALGGGLVAGIAQALGPLGILAAAIHRVSSVMEAVKQANLYQQQQSYQAAKQAKSQADATDSVRSALERQADAGRRVVEAQRGIDDARQKAIDKLNDLIAAERGLALGVDESEAAIRRAASRGQTGALPRAFLQRDANVRNLADTRQEISARQAGDVPEIAQAEEALKDAKRAADEADRALDRTKRSAGQADAAITASLGKLQFLLGQMSDAERVLYLAMINLQNVFRDFSQTVTEPLISAFTHAVGRITQLLLDPKIISAATNLSEAMATQFGRLFDAFTNNRTIGQFIRLMNQARDNLKPFTSILINLGKSFLDLGEAASPMFHDMLEWIEDITKKISEFFSQGRKSGELQGFFKEGLDQLKSWSNLLWQIIRLFAAIAGAGGGADSGKRMVDSLADTFDRWADSINEVGSKANKFFQGFFKTTERMLASTKPIFESLAREFRKTFNEDGVSSVRAFSEFIADVLIPGLGQFARFVGSLTTHIAEFARQHPLVSKIGAAIIATAASMSVLLRVFAVFGPAIHVIGFLGQRFLALTGIVGRVSAAWGSMSTTAAAMGVSIRSLAFALVRVAAPWAALIALVVTLGIRFGTFGKIWNSIKHALSEGWDRIKKPFNDLRKSVGDLFAAMGKGQGVFAVLKPLFDYLAYMIGNNIVTAFQVLGDVLGGVFRILGGVVDIITGILTLDGDKIVGGFVKIGEGIFQGIVGPLEDIGRAMLKFFRDAWNKILDWFGIKSPSRKARGLGQAILDGIENGLKGIIRIFTWPFRKAWEGVKAVFEKVKEFGGWIIEKIKDGVTNAIHTYLHIGKWLWQRISSGVENIASNLLSIGEKIIKGIVNGIKNSAHLIGDEIKKITDKIPDITPWKGLTPFAKGGPIPGRPDQGFPIMAHGGEHMFTALEVARAGGHGVMFAIRRMLGGGGQGSGGRFRVGGEVQQGGIGGVGSVAVQFAGNMDQFKDQWGSMWADVMTTARRATNAIEEQVRAMRVNTNNSLDRMYRDMRTTWSDIADSAEHWSGKLADSVKDSMDSVKESTYSGMSYVARTTNRALRSFDADPVDINISRPSSDRKASGGPVGNWGERGRDMVNTWLGRGEVVLNWAQQQAVNANMVGQNTLQSVMGRTRALHAGTYGEAFGLAGGGGHIVPFAGGEEINSKIKKLVERLVAKYHALVTDAFDRDGSANHKSPGHNVTGTAVDFVPVAGEWGLLESLGRWAVRQGFVVGYGEGVPGSQAWPGHGRGQHMHVEFGDTSGLAASIDIPEVKMPGVTGGGPMGELIKAMLRKTVKAARAFVDNQLPQVDASTYFKADADGPVAQTIENVWKKMGLPFKALLSAIETGIVESGLRNLPGGDADSMGWRQERASLYPDPRNVSHSAQRFFQEWRQMADPGESAGTIAAQVQRPAAQYAGRYQEAQAQALQVIRGLGISVPDEFAMGGQIRGRDGTPTPILAHAGEWIINKMQQAKLAQIAGMGIGKLRDLLGFKGGPTSFADGGVIEAGRQRSIARGRYEFPTVDPTALDDIEREISNVNKAIRNMSTRGKLGARLSRFFRNIRALTDEDGLLDAMGEAIEAIGTRMERQAALAAVGFRRVRGRLVRTTPMTDAVEIADNAIEMYEKIGHALRDERAVARRGLAKTNARIADIRKGGITEGERDIFVSLVAARTKFQTTINDLDEKFAANQADKYQARLDKFAATTEARLRESSEQSDVAGMWAKIGQTLGRADIVKAAGESQLDALNDRQNVLAARLRTAQERAKKDPRWQAVADKLADDMRSNAEAIVAAQAQLLTDAVSAVEKEASRRAAALDLRGRAADLMERTGNRLGAIQSRQGISRDRVANLSAEMAQLEALRNTALSQGNEGVAEDLAEKMADLNMTIQEETQTVKELDHTFRETATAIIMGTAERTTGLLASAGSIIEKLGALAGSPQTALLIQFAEAAGVALAQAAGELMDDIGAAIGTGEFGDEGTSILGQLRNAFAGGPESFATTLASLAPAISALEATMGDAERTAFQALIQAMLDNTVATLDNNQNLSDLNGTVAQAQNWSSSSWEMFRIAIFNGMGGLLPEYSAPNAPSTSAITAGVTTPGGSSSQSVEQNITLNVEKPIEEEDALSIAKRTAWELKTANTET